jgi:hypothetical protein
LKFGPSFVLNNNDMFYVSKALTSFPKLKYFYLRIWDHSNKVTDQGYGHLATAIEGLKRLTALYLVLSPRQDVKRGLWELFQSIKKANLTKLGIAFPFGSEMATSAIPNLTQAIKRLPKLTEFEFFLNQKLTQFEHQSLADLTDLVNTLKPLANLTKLSLTFRSANLPQQNLSHITNTIQQLSKLLSLSLDLGREQDLNEKNMEEIAISIASLRSLTSLNLSLNGHQNLKDEAIIVLAKNLKSVQLKSLRLNLAGVKKITDSSLFALADTILGWSALKSCKLDISSCNKIKEDGIVRLFISIGELKQLTELELAAGKCNITSISIELLGVSLRKLDNLAKLNISLCGCNEITDQDLFNLADYLQNLHTLVKLTIGLPKTGKVTQAGMKKLCETFASCKWENPIELAISMEY